MAIQIKICGINSADAADAAVRAGAHYAGLMFHPGSARNLAPQQAAGLAAHMRGRIRIVAVVADPADDMIASIVASVKPDMIQLHGRESAARTGAIRARFNLPIIKAFAIADAGDLANVASYDDAADMYLFDAKAPASAARPGGHGAAFDWSLMAGRSFARPWLLAGGLNAQNVARAIARTGAGAVDVSSGVETAPGVKDANLIGAFVTAARNAHLAAEA